jgi:hypothetical protein
LRLRLWWLGVSSSRSLLSLPRTKMYAMPTTIICYASDIHTRCDSASEICGLQPGTIR